MKPAAFSFSYLLVMMFAASGCSKTVDNIVADELKALPGWHEETEVAVPDSVLSDLYKEVSVPNPQRTNPFVAVATLSELSNEGVQLKGFVEVEEPRAILLVDNVLTVMSSNQQTRGIKVLEIRPPEILYEQNGVQHSLSLLSM